MYFTFDEILGLPVLRAAYMEPSWDRAIQAVVAGYNLTVHHGFPWTGSQMHRLCLITTRVDSGGLEVGDALDILPLLRRAQRTAGGEKGKACGVLADRLTAAIAPHFEDDAGGELDADSAVVVFM